MKRKYVPSGFELIRVVCHDVDFGRSSNHVGTVFDGPRSGLVAMLIQGGAERRIH